MTELTQQHPGVSGLVVQSVRVHELQPVGIQQQRAEHDEARDRDATQRGVHLRITCVSASSGLWVAGTSSGFRPASLIRTSSAISAHSASKDDPPYDKKGVVRPVNGINRVTPPTTTKTCSAIEKARPAPSSLPNESRTASAARKPRITSSAKIVRTAISPASPSSSPMVATMKSLLANGTMSGRPCPSPLPRIPPDAMPNIDCTSW